MIATTRNTEMANQVIRNARPVAVSPGTLCQPRERTKRTVILAKDQQKNEGDEWASHTKLSPRGRVGAHKVKRESRAGGENNKVQKRNPV